MKWFLAYSSWLWVENAVSTCSDTISDYQITQEPFPNPIVTKALVPVQNDTIVEVNNREYEATHDYEIEHINTPLVLIQKRKEDDMKQHLSLKDPEDQNQCIPHTVLQYGQNQYPCLLSRLSRSPSVSLLDHLDQLNSPSFWASPNHLLIKLETLTLINTAPDSLAIALASIVFPVPGVCIRGRPKR
ncbi:hypothetical protein Leryth_005620 [Lithospermum erythrorhizon]|nr:hypothetical protein Leryth_005620 [Lithospermum erythrorhizon]